MKLNEKFKLKIKNDRSKPVNAIKNNSIIGKLWMVDLYILFGKDNAIINYSHL